MALHEPPEPPPEVTMPEGLSLEFLNWRLDATEKRFEEFMVRSEGWHSTLGAQITALSGQLGQAIASLPDYYTPRKEGEARYESLRARVTTLESQVNLTMPRHEAEEAHRSNATRIDALEKRFDQYIERHAEEHRKDRAEHTTSINRLQDDNSKLIYFILGIGATALFAAINSATHIVGAS